jgi:hypothetical protein
MSTTRCVACKQTIPTCATICSVCKSYQRPWKNTVQYIAGIATVAILIASGMTWLWGNARGIFWYREDVRLVSANSMGSAVVVNRGDGEVFVSHLLFTMPGRSADWVARRLVFEEKLPPGQFIRREFPRPKMDDVQFVRGLKADEFEKLIVRAATGDPCYDLVFFEASDPLLHELTTMAGMTLNTFEVGGYLRYWGLSRTAPVDVALKGTGAMRRCAQN